jgi:hypothetical protein
VEIALAFDIIDIRLEPLRHVHGAQGKFVPELPRALRISEDFP